MKELFLKTKRPLKRFIFAIEGFEKLLENTLKRSPFVYTEYIRALIEKLLFSIARTPKRPEELFTKSDSHSGTRRL